MRLFVAAAVASWLSFFAVAAYYLYRTFGPPPPCPYTFWVVGDGALVQAETFARMSGPHRDLLRRSAVYPGAFCYHLLDPAAAPADFDNAHLRVGVAPHRVHAYPGVFPASSPVDAVRLTTDAEVAPVSLPDLMGRTVPTACPEPPPRNDTDPVPELSLLTVAGKLGDVSDIVFQLLHSGTLCSRVDYIEVDASAGLASTEQALEMQGVLPGLGGGDGRPRLGPELVQSLRRAREDVLCRLKEYIVTDTDGLVSEQSVVQTHSGTQSRDALESVVYAVACEAERLVRRVPAFARTWASILPERKLVIFTDRSHNITRASLPRPLPIMPVKPGEGQTFRGLVHLGRVYHGWEKMLGRDDEANWLAVVDDDTFIFPENVIQTLARFDHEANILLGSMQVATVDVGHDGGETAFSRGVWERVNASCILGKDCGETLCESCPPIPHASAVFLSRGLVETLQPFLGACQRDLKPMCDDCGVERLYACIHSHVADVESVSLRGVHPRPWRGEPREATLEESDDVWPLSFHGFEADGGKHSSTGSLRGDYEELWSLREVARRRSARMEGSPLVGMRDVAEAVECLGLRRWVGGQCVGFEELTAPLEL